MALSNDNLIELLVDRATEGLSKSEQDQLDELLRGHPEVDPETFERAAAAVHLAVVPPTERLPDHLRSALEEDAAKFFRHDAFGAPPDNVVRLERQVAPAPKPNPWPWLATAAALLLAVAGWWPGTEPDAPTFAEQRAALIDQGAVVVSWTATEDPTATGVMGDVVWSQSGQRGFMLFSGLEPNLPTSFQYQLWIFDASRDERYPVDGGVFDIPAGANEVVIPILPRVPIDEAVLFAVTVEAPGGVVVSDRERIAVLAELG